MNGSVNREIVVDVSDINAQPFLKWAGGKRWLVPEIENMIFRSMNRYIEPFLGGGAVFFACSPGNALLSDSNAELIETYEAIKQSWQNVWDKLGMAPSASFS
jgi:DNA adenine methylase